MASYVIHSVGRPTTPRRESRKLHDTINPPSPQSVAELDAANNSVQQRPNRTVFPIFRKKNMNAVGTQWSAELAKLRNVGSSFEAAICLRNVEELLLNVDYTDRIRFCKEDFTQSITALKAKPQMWHRDLMQDVVSIICTYFNQNEFRNTPHCILMSIFMWLPIGDFSVICRVCREWNQLSRSQFIWKTFYHYRFLRTNTIFIKLSESEQKLASTSLDLGSTSNRNLVKCYRQEFRQRLLDPNIGDKVEVAWRGKFRLDGAEVYQGLAWWVAEVVDKHSAVAKYKIRYPGWDSRWDEWVPKSRLRWSVEDNTVASIQVNDRVEIWCCGASVPGAWLDSRVKKIRGGRYCVGKVIANGSLWVDRSRLRPATCHHLKAAEDSLAPRQVGSHTADRLNAPGAAADGEADVPQLEINRDNSFNNEQPRLGDDATNNNNNNINPPPVRRRRGVLVRTLRRMTYWWRQQRRRPVAENPWLAPEENNAVGNDIGDGVGDGGRHRMIGLWSPRPQEPRRTLLDRHLEQTITVMQLQLPRRDDDIVDGVDGVDAEEDIDMDAGDEERDMNDPDVTLTPRPNPQERALAAEVDFLRLIHRPMPWVSETDRNINIDIGDDRDFQLHMLQQYRRHQHQDRQLGRCAIM